MCAFLGRKNKHICSKMITFAVDFRKKSKTQQVELQNSYRTSLSL